MSGFMVSDRASKGLAFGINKLLGALCMDLGQPAAILPRDLLLNNGGRDQTVKRGQAWARSKLVRDRPCWAGPLAWGPEPALVLK